MSARLESCLYATPGFVRLWGELFRYKHSIIKLISHKYNQIGLIVKSVGCFSFHLRALVNHPCSVASSWVAWMDNQHLHSQARERPFLDRSKLFQLFSCWPDQAILYICYYIVQESQSLLCTVALFCSH